MSIFCVGQSAYDITVPTREPIVENRKYRMTEVFECGGGPALNSACLCAMWGAPVQLVSRIGRDQYGEKLKKILADYGVGMDYLIPDQKIQTPYSYIFSNEITGSRTIFNYPGQFSDVVYDLEGKNPTVILSDGHEEEISIQLIEHYPKAISVVDAGTCRDSTLSVAKHVDYLVCSEDFARQYTEKGVDLDNWELCKEIFAQVEKINGRYAVITLGEKGLLYKEGNELRHLPAYRVKAVDTTGAGDIFHGAFAYGVYQGMSLLDNLKQSSMASAISVQTLGGQASIPGLDAVQNGVKNGI